MQLHMQSSCALTPPVFPAPHHIALVGCVCVLLWRSRAYPVASSCQYTALTCTVLAPKVTQAGQDGSQCGIGVVFRMDNHGALVVDSLVPGGPAWESSTQGGLQVGDVLQTVDGKNVYRCPFHDQLSCVVTSEIVKY
jgi:hypothetical protein